MMANRDAVAISSRLFQLQKIDGMSMKGHIPLQAMGERNGQRLASPIAVFFNELKSKRIVLASILCYFQSAHWRKICFKSNRPTPIRPIPRKRPFSGLTTISTAAVVTAATLGK